NSKPDWPFLNAARSIFTVDHCELTPAYTCCRTPHRSAAAPTSVARAGVPRTKLDAQNACLAPLTVQLGVFTVMLVCALTMTGSVTVCVSAPLIVWVTSPVMVESWV